MLGFTLFLDKNRANVTRWRVRRRPTSVNDM